jgi:hypothetical protein
LLPTSSRNRVAFIKDLKVREHTAYLYDMVDDKQIILFSYVMNAIEEGGLAVYIAGRQGKKGIRLSMRDFGIDVNRSEERHALQILDASEFFLEKENGPVKSAIKIEQQYKTLVETSLNYGLKSLRIAAETDDLMHKKRGNDYISQDLLLGKELPFEATLVCAFDLREMNNDSDKEAKEQLTKKVQDAHHTYISPYQTGIPDAHV